MQDALERFDDLTAKGVSPVVAIVCVAAHFWLPEETLRRAIAARYVVQGVVVRDDGHDHPQRPYGVLHPTRAGRRAFDHVEAPAP